MCSSDLNFIESAGADRVLTLDMHAGQIQGFFNIPLDELTAFPLIAEHFRQKQLPAPVVVAADVGRAKLAREIAGRIDADIAIVDKKRDGNTDNASALTMIGEVEGRDCLIIDDEVLTGGTVASAVKLLRTRGARSVRVAFVHPVLAKKAFTVLDTSDVDEVVFTDTLPLVHGTFTHVPTTVLSVAPLIGDAMHRIHTGGSVGELFL